VLLITHVQVLRDFRASKVAKLADTLPKIRDHMLSNTPLFNDSEFATKLAESEILETARNMSIAFIQAQQHDCNFLRLFFSFFNIPDTFSGFHHAVL
jgi:hypothetical protein